MAPTGKPENSENKENVSPDESQNASKEVSNTDKPNSAASKQKSKVTKSRSKSPSAGSEKSNASTSSEKLKQKSAVKRSAAQIMQNVNKALGLSKDTQNLPKIPKLTPRVPAQAAGSAQAHASDPIMHSTPVQGQGQVMYPYRPPATPANQSQYDPVPQYLQDLSNITPIHAQGQGQANQFNQSMIQPQNAQMHNFSGNAAQVQPPQQFMFQPNQMQYQNFTPQYMGQPRTIDQSSNLVVIPTPMYPTQPYVIADRNSIVTVPLGGHQNFPQQNFGPPAEQIPQDQGILPLEPNLEEDEFEDTYGNGQELDKAVDNNIEELLNDRAQNAPEEKQAAAPVDQPVNQEAQPAQDDLQEEEEPELPPPVHDEYEYLEDELDNDDEEIGPPIANNTLQRVVDGVWDQALRRPESLKMKNVYESIYRPSNISNLMKTQVNPLVKESTARDAFRNDGLPRSIQTGIIKGALSLVDVLQSVADIQVPEEATEQEMQQSLADQRKSILQEGLKSVKCLAYSTTKVNQLRRRLQKPYLNRRYQRLCTRQNQPSHQWLYGDDVVEEIRSQDQANRLSRNLAPRRRYMRGSRGLNQTYPPAYRGRGGQYQQFQGFRQPGNLQFVSHILRTPGMSFNCFPRLNYIHGNLVKCVDDRNMPMPTLNMSQQMHINMSMQNLNNNKFLCCSSSTAAVQRGSQRWTAEQRQGPRPWQPEPEPEPQLTCHLVMPDRSVTPVSETYAASLGIKFTNFQQGGLNKKLENWRKLTSDPHILELVQGIKLDFLEPPAQDKIPNEIIFSKEDQELVRLELERFLELGILEESTIQPGDFVSNLFIRHKKEPGKIRILANLKKLNVFVRHIHFKMDTLDSVIQMIRPGSYMVTIDLESSFYSLNVHPSYRKYLKVICLGKTYVFKKLPMGYSQSPVQFTKLMKIPLTYLRSEFGYTNSAFVDDLILIEDTYDFAKKSSVDTVDTLHFLGYTINVPKSGLEPRQKRVHLGVILNSIDMTVTLTQEKVDKLLDHAQKILEQKHVQIRSLASLIGQMNAARYAVYYGPLHTKSLEIAKNLALARSKGDFDAFMTLSPLDKVDIQWWIDHAPYAFKQIIAPPVDFIVFTDASLLGYGYKLQETGQTGGARWSENEQKLHINQLEIRAIHLSLLCFFFRKESLAYQSVFRFSGRHQLHQYIWQHKVNEMQLSYQKSTPIL